MTGYFWSPILSKNRGEYLTGKDHLVHKMPTPTNLYALPMYTTACGYVGYYLPHRDLGRKNRQRCKRCEEFEQRFKNQEKEGDG